MTQQLIIWFAVVIVMMMVFVTKGVRKLNTLYRLDKRVRGYVQLGSERDIFFCPGDEFMYDEDDM